MSIDYEDERDYGGDEVFEDTGSMHSDTDVSVLHDMERELEGLVRKYQVPSNELDNLLKVVMTMSEMMDHRREELEKVVEQKAELEEMWNKEKEKWRLLHTRKLELECRYDEERTKHESERRRLESEKTQLETRTQQLNKLNVELQSEIQRLLAKADQDEKTRHVLREQYKREFELKRNASVRRKGTFKGRRPYNDGNSSLRRPGQSQLPSSASTDQRSGGLEDSMSYEVISEKPTQAVTFSNNANEKLSLERSGSFVTQDQPAHSFSQDKHSSRPSSMVVVDPPSFTRSSSEDTERAVTPISPATPRMICPAGTSLQDELMGGPDSMALLDPCASLMDEQLNTSNVESSQDVKKESNELESAESNNEGLEIQESAQSVLGVSDAQEESINPLTGTWEEQESAKTVVERSDEQEPVQPVSERLEEYESAQILIKGLEEQESAEPVIESSEEHELEEPETERLEVQECAIDKLEKQELAHPTGERLDENESTQPANERLEEQESTQPADKRLEENESTQPADERLEENESTQPAGGRLEEQESTPSADERLEEQKSTPPADERLEEQESTQPADERLEENESTQPADERLEENESTQPAGGRLEEQESTPSADERLEEQESTPPADERLEEQESTQPADERLEEQESTPPAGGRLEEQELVQPESMRMEVEDEQETVQPINTESHKQELQSESTEQLFRNEETASLHELQGALSVQPMNEQKVAQQEEEKQDVEQEEEEIEYEETEDENQIFLESQSVGSDLDELIVPEVIAMERAEAEMLRQEKEAWKEETARLLLEKKFMREEKEALESQVAQLLLETAHLKEAEDALRKDLQDMKNERDEVLANYFDQTYSDHCITKKELFDVLKKLENTKIELEVAREEKSIGQEMLTIRRPPPIQMSSLAEGEVEHETVMNLTANHDWRVAQGSSVRLDQIPTWVEQIHLKGIETVHVDKIVIGKTYHGSSAPNRLTRTRPTFSKTLGMPGTSGTQWCVEASMSRIRQRFVVQQAKNIQCMKYIPGGVDQGDESTTEQLHLDTELEATASGCASTQPQTPATSSSTACTSATRPSASNSPVWNIYSPSKQVSLVQLDPDGQQDVTCMTEVGTRLWVICGKWIYLLDRVELISEGSIFLEDSSSTLDSIVSVGSYAAVLVNSSSINIYDAVSAAILKKLTISSLFSTLAESTGTSLAVYITAITADHQNIYVGTSNGKIIAVFLRGLMSSNTRRNEAGNALLNQTCVSIHSHREKIDSLMYIPLSLQQDAHPQNEGSSLTYTSLVVSTGKGYQRYTDIQVQVEGEVLEEVDDHFQVMVWGRPIGR
eukprot:Em0016g895a